MTEQNKIKRIKTLFHVQPKKLSWEVKCAFGAGLFLVTSLFVIDYLALFNITYQPLVVAKITDDQGTTSISTILPPTSPPVLDLEGYNRKLLALANNGLLDLLHATTTTILVASSTASTTETILKTVIPPTATELVSSTKENWPAKAVYPKVGALLPFNRIVAYYGNFYSTKMGVLGEYPADEMLERLLTEVKNWQLTDPDTPVIPAIDYIAMTAQASAGEDGLYRFRMPKDQIEQAIELAKKVNGIVILEVQAGLANLQQEIQSLEPYLSLPEVHLAIDPEFHMVTGARPGTIIGTISAQEINQASEYLASLVLKNNLPPKVLVVHRFTYAMITNFSLIKPLPEVQIIIDMDGWGEPAKKFGTYNQVIEPEPVQFTGFKLFYKNDLKPPSTHLLTPDEVLKLSPQPSFIQYQ